MISAAFMDHTCTIRRLAWTTDSDTGQTYQSDTLDVIATGVPCHLSQKSRNYNANQTATPNEISSNPVIYFHTGADILAGDQLAVNVFGQEKTGNAGDPYFYRDHVEVPLLQEADA